MSCHVFILLRLNSPVKLTAMAKVKRLFLVFLELNLNSIIIYQFDVIQGSFGS